MVLMVTMGSGVVWAEKKPQKTGSSERQSQNPSSAEKPPVSTNPTDCAGKDTNSWCRSGKDEGTVEQARSAQAVPTGGSVLRFGGVHGKNMKYSGLKPTADQHK